MRTLCFGSLNIDYTYQVDHFARRGETVSSRSLRIFAGGKGLNQSIALARAGANTCHAGAVGEDGLFLLDQLRAAGVDTSHVAVLPNVRTGHAVIQSAPGGDNCILLHGGANMSVTRAQIDATLSQFGQGDILVLQNEINELDYLIRRGKERGMVVALNPSPMDAAVKALPLDLVDFLLLNEVEAGQLLGRTIGPEPEGRRAAEELHALYPSAVVVLTLGGAGAVYAGWSQTFSQPACKVVPVDTTGAGDTFTGFFLASRQRGLAPTQAMAMAAKAAALAVTRPGASPSIPTLEEVLAFSTP